MGNPSELKATADAVNKALGKVIEGLTELQDAMGKSNSIVVGLYQQFADLGNTAGTTSAPPAANDTPPSNDDINLDNDAPVAADVVVDADGVPYNPDLHADKDKGTTGGKDKNGRWKMKRNTDRAAFNAWRDEHKKEVETENSPASNNATPPPTGGATPPASNNATPPPPGGATPPVTQTDNASSVKYNQDKSAAIHCYKILTEEFHIDHDDLVEEVNDVLSVPATDDGGVNFSGMGFEKTGKLREMWEGRVEFYKSTAAKVAEMYQWVGDQSSYVDGALANLYSNYNTESFSGVHYTDLESFATDFAGVYNEYHQWALDNKRI